MSAELFTSNHAIATLRNAIDHLSDSHIFLNPNTPQKDDTDAIRILMRLQRRVFEQPTDVSQAPAQFEAWMVPYRPSSNLQMLSF